MHSLKSVGKRDFIQHTSKYLKWVEEHDQELIITHHNLPDLVIMRIKPKTLKDLQGFINIKEHGDVNESVLPGYDQW